MRADVDAAAWGTLYRLALNTVVRSVGGPLLVGGCLVSRQSSSSSGQRPDRLQNLQNPREKTALEKI